MPSRRFFIWSTNTARRERMMWVGRRVGALLTVTGLLLASVACDRLFPNDDDNDDQPPLNEDPSFLESKVDLLFVVDDSPSMAGVQQRLARDLSGLVEALVDHRVEESREAVDFQIGVASTSVYSRLVVQDNTHHIEEYSIGNDRACLDGSAYEIESGMPYPVAQLMAAADNPPLLTTQHFAEDRQTALRRLRENLILGSCGSVQPQGFEAMRRVLESNPDVFRDRSRLVVVFVSKSEDASDETGNFVSWIIDDSGERDQRLDPEAREGLTPVSVYLGFLEEMARERESSFAIATIVSAIGEPPHHLQAEIGSEADHYNCIEPDCPPECTEYCETTYCPGRCDLERLSEESEENYEARIQSCLNLCLDHCGDDPRAGPCWCHGRSPGVRYLEAARSLSTTARTMDSACRTNFTETLEHVARIAGPVTCAALDPPPDGHDPSMVFLRIERNDSLLFCEPPGSNGEAACDYYSDWWYEPNRSMLCICPNSACRLEPGDTYRLSVIAENLGDGG